MIGLSHIYVIVTEFGGELVVSLPLDLCRAMLTAFFTCGQDRGFPVQHDLAMLFCSCKSWNLLAFFSKEGGGGWGWLEEEERG